MCLVLEVVRVSLSLIDVFCVKTLLYSVLCCLYNGSYP